MGGTWHNRVISYSVGWKIEGSSKGIPMTMENIIRAMAGTLVLTGVALSHWVNVNWIWLSVFVGVNLLQSAFTHFCPAEIVLTRLGVGKGKCCQ